MLINRRHLRRPLHLPPINPELSPIITPTISSTIDATISLTPPEQPLYSPRWYANAFKLFQKDLSSNKLQTQFDQMIEDALSSRRIQQTVISQDQFVKQISNEIKVKLFQEYLKKKKEGEERAGKKGGLKKREKSWTQRRSRTRIEGSLGREKLLSQEKDGGNNKLSQRIFGIEGMFKNQEGLVSPRSKKYKNFRVYHQGINPMHLINN